MLVILGLVSWASSEGFSTGNAMNMGEKVGKVMAFENPIEERKIGRNFIKEQVLVDLKNPLVEGF